MFIRTLLVFALLASCAPTERYSRKKGQVELKRLEHEGFVVGRFKLGSDAVVDGDTIRVQGVKTTLRLLGIDTEETYKNNADKVAATADFQAYLKAKRGDSIKPVKMGTPIGEEAKDWASAFFKGVKEVRLERDRPKEIRGRYGRYLVYVFATKNGKELNYNVESVRAGMSPYFMKYGYSSRFHNEFVQAEQEARAAKVGIWNENSLGYKDYPERIVWWESRAKFIKDFEDNYPGSGIILTNWDSLHRLEKAKVSKQEVSVLGTVSSIKLGDKGPTRVMLGRKRGDDFPLIFFDKDLFGSLGLADHRSEHVIATGVVTEYKHPRASRPQLQIEITRPSQIILAPVPYKKQKEESQ